MNTIQKLTEGSTNHSISGKAFFPEEWKADLWPSIFHQTETAAEEGQ